jgi:hypothetical protein
MVDAAVVRLLAVHRAESSLAIITALLWLASAWPLSADFGKYAIY